MSDCSCANRSSYCIRPTQWCMSSPSRIRSAGDLAMMQMNALRLLCCKGEYFSATSENFCISACFLPASSSAFFSAYCCVRRSWEYSILKIEKERGTMDDKTENKKYYLMSAKIYAQRFSTDCFSDYFNDMARRSYTGLADYLEYATEKASVEELRMQNSYFINSLYRDADGDGSA